MHYTARATALLVVLVAALAGVILIASFLQRSSVDRSVEQAATAEQLVIAQLDLETGLRGFLQFGDPRFLEPYRAGAKEFKEALADSLAAAADDEALTASIQRQGALSERWRERSDGAVADRRVGQLPSLGSALRRKSIVDAFRAENTDLRALVEERRKASADRATATVLALVVGLSLLFGGVGYVRIVRPSRDRMRTEAEAAEYRRAGDEFTATLQAIDEEDSAQRLLKRHIERDIAACQVVVLNRNSSNNRLEAVTESEAGSALEERLVDAVPRSCLAVRLGREHREQGDTDPLISCELCGATGASLCVPSIIGGEVVGSVLIQSAEPLEDLHRQRVLSAVTQAGPVIANLRSLAIAETRAATDSLTGLANRRACDETMRRMVAHSARTVSSLAALAIDLDHFKQINDRFGHGAGDDVLAAVGAVLSERLRASDFAGRPGGEEFIALLPDTDAESAVAVAESLRTAIASISVPTVDAPITASFGVATHPADAGDAENLMRLADRALYAAKAAGRNRVERAPGALAAADRAQSSPAIT